MGLHAAACMAGKQEDTGASMAFEMFTHVTRFLGRKVVLLGGWVRLAACSVERAVNARPAGRVCGSVHSASGCGGRTT